MKIMTIVGTRPEFIQLGPLSKEIRKQDEELIVHSGQHYNEEMSKYFFDELNLPNPDYNLNVGSGTQGYQTGEMIKKIESVLLKEKPDIVVVFGDTNTTFGGAYAAVKLHVKVAHVEAGLRSFNKDMPEEINRLLSDRISDLLFAPTETAVINLKNEGIGKGVFQVGDVMYDSIIQNTKVASRKSDILMKLGLEQGNYNVLTIHRPENTDNYEKMGDIFQTLISSGKKFIFPVHPRTRKCLIEYGLLNTISESNIECISPLGYYDFIVLMKNSLKILTDSGGVQKQAYFLKIPCITLRGETEWVETVEDGWNIIVGSKPNKLLEAIDNFIPSNIQTNPFGNGKASQKIVNILQSQ